MKFNSSLIFCFVILFTPYSFGLEEKMIRKTGITSDKGCQELLVSSNALLYHSLVQLTWREFKILDLKPKPFNNLIFIFISKFLTLSLMLHTLR